MSDQSTSLPLDFTIDANDVDTSMPLLKEGAYIVSIGDVVFAENATKTGINAKVTFLTTNPQVSTEEQPLKPGYKLTRYFPLQAKPGSDYDFRKNLCELIDAALKTKQGERPPITPDLLLSLKGKELIATVKIRTDTEGQYAGRQSCDVQRLRALS